MSGDDLIDRKELCRRFSLTPRQVITLQQKRRIPFIRLGHKTVRYNPAAVQQALEPFTVKAVAVTAVKSSEDRWR